jgi:gluconolactonase
MVPVEGTTDQFVVGVGLKFQVVRWDGRDGSAPELVRELGSVDQNSPKNRLNDGKADPKGRLFAGNLISII